MYPPLTERSPEFWNSAQSAIAVRFFQALL